jgi:hypothetical protein
MSTEEDIVCSICLNGDVEENNEIVLCSGSVCGGIAVHQACYGINHIPSDDYYCKACQFLLSNPDTHIKPSCILCPNPGGALCLSLDEEWLHTQCALWLEARFTDVDNMNLVDICSIDKIRYRLSCSLCNVKKGALVQCAASNCRQSFHISCAAQHKNYIELADLTDSATPIACCDKHSNISTIEKIKGRIKGEIAKRSKNANIASSEEREEEQLQEQEERNQLKNNKPVKDNLDNDMGQSDNNTNSASIAAQDEVDSLGEEMKLLSNKEETQGKFFAI